MKTVSSYHVYVVTNADRSDLMIGMTNDLCERLEDLRLQQFDQPFCSPEKMCFLIYFEEYRDLLAALKRETEIRIMREKKIWQMIKACNPGLKFYNHLYFALQDSV